MPEAPRRAGERCGETHFGSATAPACGTRLREVAFTGRKPRDDTDEGPSLVLQLAGTTMALAGSAPALLRPGDIALVEGGTAGWSSAGTGPCRQLWLPLRLASPPCRPQHGMLPQLRLLDGHTGLGALLARLLHGLRDEESNLDAGGRAAVGNAIAGLIAAALRSSPSAADEAAPGPCPGSAAGARWPALCAVIEARLHEPGLCPDGVARSTGISTRHLHRLFHEAGTSFGTFVRNLRLARCSADLADPRCAGLSVTAVAFRWGFSDSAHFARSFKAAYGITARAFRQRRLSPLPSADLPTCPEADQRGGNHSTGRPASRRRLQRVGGQSELTEKIEPVEIEPIVDDHPVVETPEIDGRNIDLTAGRRRVATRQRQRSAEGAEGVQFEGDGIPLLGRKAAQLMEEIGQGAEVHDHPLAVGFAAGK